MATNRDVLASVAIRFMIDSANMSKSLNKIQSDMNIFKNGLKSLGRLIAGAFAVDQIVRFGKESFAAYQEQFKAEQLLLAALKGRKDIQERLIQQSQYLQNTTLFGDEEIINLQKMLAATGKTEKQIRLIIQAATELSTAKGTSLGESVEALSKTYGGNLRLLGQLIPEIKKFSKEQLAAGEAVKWVNENMKGLAETAANTDPVTQMTKAWNELKESFGSAIAPSATKFMKRGAKEFTIWGSQDLSFLQKASQLFNKKRTDELYDYIIGLQKTREVQNDSVASDEVLTKSVQGETIAREKLQRQLEANTAKRKEEFNLSAGRELTALFASTEHATPLKAQVTGGANAPVSDLGTASRWEENYQQILLFKQKTEDLMKEMSASIQQGFTNMAEGFGEALGTMLATSKKFDFSFIMNAFGGMAVSLGKILIASGMAGIALKKLINNPYLAVAAGIALVAVGTAARIAANNVVNGGGASAVSMSSSSSSSNGELINRGFLEGNKMQIEVIGTMRNDHIYFSSVRGKQQTSRY